VSRKLSFSVGCLYELGLLALAVLWGWLFHRSALLHLHWSLISVLIGIVGAIPPFLFFVWSLNSNLHAFARHKELMESLLRPVFGNWSLLQLAIISTCAGISEEAFFRGAVQGTLADRVGMTFALVLASVVFGAAHLITWTYAVIAALIGLYLGLLWLWTGNLLMPMINHAVYDFAALVYFLRTNRSR
jgi:membrane protease YdiL (CAAX protease family)